MQEGKTIVALLSPFPLPPSARALMRSSQPAAPRFCKTRKWGFSRRVSRIELSSPHTVVDLRSSKWIAIAAIAYRFVPFIFGESHQFRRCPQTAAIACKGSELNKSMKAQIATSKKNLYHLKLWGHFLLSVAIHNLNRRSCFVAARARVEVLFEGYQLQNDRSHSSHSKM